MIPSCGVSHQLGDNCPMSYLPIFFFFTKPVTKKQKKDKIRNIKEPPINGQVLEDRLCGLLHIYKNKQLRQEAF